MKVYYVISLCLFLSMTILKAQDWAQLNRFKAENELLLPPAKNENRVVFIGNSITEGWRNDSLSLFKNPSFINRGIGGQTTSQMKIRFWQDVIKLNPKVVVILAGINDIAQNTGPIALSEIAKNIEEMTQLAKAHRIKVVVCSVLPANYFPWRPQILTSEKVIALNAMLKSLAIKQDVTYLDYYTFMVNDTKGMKEEYTYDGVHCTLEGYRKMETILLPCLEKLF
ncbi:MAG: SGNH/GDSL hydrolase family protein [Flavobacteriaceae bacterium]